mmetsp:Transcript_30983/g.74527  ORF Transcript_30983/g.74527 Transcript_30983/m.74527 type:complete len:98 (+) Transcript_30983:40-333(+)
MKGFSALTALFLLVVPAQSFVVISPSSSSVATTSMVPTIMHMINPLDAMNEEIRKQKKEEDEDAPMTKAEMRQAEKEMKAEMKRLKEEAAAAAKKEE